MNADPFAVDAVLARWQRVALVAGVVALVVCVAGAFLGDAGGFFRAWLPAYLFWLGLGLGGMAILMVYHLTGGAWGYLIRRILEAQTRTLPLMVLFFLPIAFGLPHLYPWAERDAPGLDPRFAEQRFYLNPPAFWTRAAIYFVLWLGLSWRLLAWSRRQDAEGGAGLPWKFQRLSEIGLVLFGTSMHFAAFDWAQMLQPSFRSTIFPMLLVAGQLVSALALALVVFRTASAGLEAEEVFSTRALNDLGNLQLAFLVVWAYLLWFQFMLIWMANLPYGLEWHLPRLRGGWLVVTLLVVFVHFFVPFLLLLFRAVKRDRKSLALVAGLVLAMHLVYDYGLVAPSFELLGVGASWLYFVAPIAIGGVWIGVFLRALRGRPLLVANDPNRARAVHLRALDFEEHEREEALAHG